MDIKKPRIKKDNTEEVQKSKVLKQKYNENMIKKTTWKGKYQSMNNTK